MIGTGTSGSAAAGVTTASLEAAASALLPLEPAEEAAAAVATAAAAAKPAAPAPAATAPADALTGLDAVLSSAPETARVADLVATGAVVDSADAAGSSPAQWATAVFTMGP